MSGRIADMQLGRRFSCILFMIWKGLTHQRSSQESKNIALLLQSKLDMMMWRVRMLKSCLNPIVKTSHVDMIDNNLLLLRNRSQRWRPRCRELSTSLLFSTPKQLQLLEDNDCTAERSQIEVHRIRSYLVPYEQLLYEGRKMAKQQNLDVFF